MALQPLIKICGITREADAEAALRLGADALGFVFFSDSPRHVPVELAANLCRLVGDRALKVGLFVDAEPEEVRAALKRVPLDILQFHGSEPATYCGAFRRPWWKALKVKERESLATALQAYPDANGILLDAWHPQQHGGTGRSFDWSLLERQTVTPHLILAGGLTPANVAQAVAQVRPWAVDVSSGVEEAPGIKSAALMKKFIEEVKSV